MRIIDLLNKIANGEELPKKIKYNDKIFINDGFSYIYENKTFNEYNRLEEFISYGSDLNDEVEIIKEKKKTLEEEFEEYNKRKKIDKISLHFDENLSEFLATTSINALDYEEICQGGFERLLIDKINEIIDCLDYLKSKGEE